MRRLISACLRHPAVRRVLIRSAAFRRAYGLRIYWDWHWPHPIDAEYGIDTSGRVAEEELRTRVPAVGADAVLSREIVGYIGSQPSIVRRALDSLPDVAGASGYGFVDIGCGKGRVLVLASERGLAGLLGVEIDAELAAIARANAAVVAARFPGRPGITVETGDATAVAPPWRRVVFYVYHAFGAELMARLCRRIEELVGPHIDHCFLVYYNPVCAAVFDASPALQRWFAAEVPYAAAEHGFGPNRADTVVIWQSRHGALPPHDPGRDRAVVPGTQMHATLA